MGELVWPSSVYLLSPRAWGLPGGFFYLHETCPQRSSSAGLFLFILKAEVRNMAYVEYNPNPAGRHVGDCSVRAIAKALKLDWEDAYMLLARAGFDMCDMPSSDSVWGAVLRQHGFYRKAISNACPDCYSASDFCIDHPVGTFVLAFGGHVATVRDGNIYDSWDSSREIPQYYWEAI